MSTHRILAAAAALAAALLAAPAAAAFGPTCPPGGCRFDPADGPAFDFDYTVPPDGRTYLWAVDFTTADPLAVITLGVPTQTEIITTIRNGAGFDTVFDDNPPYTFIPTITPGRSTWRVRAPRAFDFCASPGPDGEVCAADVRIWGNGTFLSVNSESPVLAVFSESVVPEPGVWAGLVVGFALVGAMVRRQRAAATA